jgi:hypothetical protein
METTQLILSGQEDKLKLAISKAKTPDLIPFIKAQDSLKVHQATDDQIEEKLISVISTTVFELGQQPRSTQDLLMMSQSLLPEVKSMFSNLTLEELSLSAHQGAMGYYGEFFGVNPVTLLKWFNSMLMDMKRQNAKRLLLEEPKPLQIERSLSDKERIQVAITAFEKFKTAGTYEDWGNLVYNFLESKELITYTNERKEQMKLQVLAKELERLSAPVTLDEKRTFDREKNRLLEGQTDLKGKCKRHALNIYFSELVEMGQELKDLIATINK